MQNTLDSLTEQNITNISLANFYNSNESINQIVKNLVEAMLFVSSDSIKLEDLERKALEYIETNIQSKASTEHNIPIDAYKRAYNAVHWTLTQGGNGVIYCRHFSKDGTLWMSDGGDINYWTKQVIAQHKELLKERLSSKYIRE
ncbi:MAG: hypothetical protein ACMXYG_06750 [Candidatus Woesearchaeota archaeon]